MDSLQTAWPFPGRVVYVDELKHPKNRNNSALFGYMQFGSLYVLWRGFSGGSAVKNLPAMQETMVRALGWEDPLEKQIATHSNILAWEIPWTNEPGGLQSTGSQDTT